MKRIAGLILFSFIGTMVFSQAAISDSLTIGTVTVIKDNRLDALAKKQVEFNEAVASGIRVMKGYRLLVLSSNDRNYAMKVRAQLLQNFPEQKVYMAFQSPYIKLKMGNFVEKSDAEKYRNLITRGKIVNTNVYLVTEMVEVKPDKNKEKEEN